MALFQDIMMAPWWDSAVESLTPTRASGGRNNVTLSEEEQRKHEEARRGIGGWIDRNVKQTVPGNTRAARRDPQATAALVEKRLQGPLGTNPYMQRPQQPPQGNPMFPNGNPMGAISQFIMDPQGAPGNPAQTPVATPGINPNAPAPQRPQEAPQVPQTAPAPPQAATGAPRVPGAEQGRPGVAQPQQLLDFVAQHESNGNYNAIFGNANNQEDLGQYTLDEIIQKSKQHGKKTGSGAIGRYQFMNYTLEDLKGTLGLTGDEKFTPELQDMLGMALLERRGFNEFQRGDMSAEEFMDNLSKEWAALPAASGKSHYDGVMGNKALTDRQSVMDMLYGGGPQPDTRMASSSPMADEMAGGTEGLADRGPQGQQQQGPPGWLPEGYGSVEEWIMSAEGNAPLIQNGKLSVGSLLGLKKGDPTQEMVKRARLAQAMQQMGQNPNAMTEYQRAQAELARDKFRHAQEMDLAEMSGYTGGTGGTGGTTDVGPVAPSSDIVLQGSPELYQQKYGDSGTTGVRDYTKAVDSVETTLSGVAEAMDVMERGFDENALGPKWNQASFTGQAWDAAGSFIGSKEADADKAIRGQVDQLKFKLIQPFLDSMKGALSDKDMKLLLDAAPGVTSTKEEWIRFRDRAIRTAAKGIAHLNPQISEEQAIQMAQQKFQQYRSRTDPSSRLSQEAQQFYDTPQGAQELDQFYD